MERKEYLFSLGQSGGYLVVGDQGSFDRVIKEILSGWQVKKENNPNLISFDQEKIGID